MVMTAAEKLALAQSLSSPPKTTFITKVKAAMSRPLKSKVIGLIRLSLLILYFPFAIVSINPFSLNLEMHPEM